MNAPTARATTAARSLEEKTLQLSISQGTTPTKTVNGNGGFVQWNSLDSQKVLVRR